MASDTPDVHDRAFRAALAEALSLARDPRHVVALSRVYAHAVGASDPDDPLAKAALAAADVAVAEDLAAPTPRVVRRPSSPYSPVRASSDVAPVSPPPSVPVVAPVSPPSIPAVDPGVRRVPSPDPDRRRTDARWTRVPSPEPDAGRPPTAPAPPRLAPGVARVPSPDPDTEPEPDVMPCQRTNRKELRDKKRQEERRFRKLLARAREESAARTCVEINQ